MEGESVRERVLNAAENHPYILLACVLVLVIIMIVMYLNLKGYLGQERLKSKVSKKAKTGDGLDGEIDALIDSIHEKQNIK